MLMVFPGSSIEHVILSLFSSSLSKELFIQNNCEGEKFFTTTQSSGNKFEPVSSDDHQSVAIWVRMTLSAK